MADQPDRSQMSIVERLSQRRRDIEAGNLATEAVGDRGRNVGEVRTAIDPSAAQDESFIQRQLKRIELMLLRMRPPDSTQRGQRQQ